MNDRVWTVEEFVAADQTGFGDAWRYELVEGQVIAQEAPSAEHGAIVAGLIAALGARLSGMPNGCRPETGSSVIPIAGTGGTARIPDVMVRCGERARVVFDVLGAPDICDMRARDLKRQHLQAFEGVQEIVELSQGDFAAHVYRLMPGGAWVFEALGGSDGVLRLHCISVQMPLSEVYAFATIRQPTAGG